MDIGLGEPKIYSLDARLSHDELRHRAEERKTSALGTGIGGLFQRPKAEDVVQVASQRRVEPFWHVACRSHQVYDRTRIYAVPASASDVRAVTLLGSDFDVVQSGKGPAAFSISVLEHCREDFRDELFVDGITGSPLSDGPALAAGARTEVADPTLLATDDTIVVPPEQRASAIVRQLLAKMLRPLQADTIMEESLDVESLELFYRPVWAFEFHWPAKDRRGVVEIDALTGEARNATSLKGSLTKIMSKDSLFDIGADTIGLIVPGGGIAVKLARVAIDRSY